MSSSNRSARRGTSLPPPNANRTRSKNFASTAARAARQRARSRPGSSCSRSRSPASTTRAKLGKDEISLAGIRQEATIDAASGKIAGSRAIVDPVALGKFKGGDAPRPINRVLASFDLANAPKLCTFELFIAETDVLKGFANELKEARDFFPDHLSEIVSSIATAGLLLGASTLLFPGSWAVWVMVLVIIAIVLLGNAIYAGLRDDVFPSRQTGIPVTAPDFTFPGGALETDVQTAVFSKFGGTYRLDFIWRLV